MSDSTSAAAWSNHAGTVGRLTAIIECSPTAMIMVDGAGRIVLINAETEKLFGYPRSELFTAESAKRPVGLRLAPKAFEGLVDGATAGERRDAHFGVVQLARTQPEFGEGAKRTCGHLFQHAGAAPLHDAGGEGLGPVIDQLFERRRKLRRPRTRGLPPEPFQQSGGA